MYTYILSTVQTGVQISGIVSRTYSPVPPVFRNGMTWRLKTKKKKDKNKEKIYFLPASFCEYASFKIITY